MMNNKNEVMDCLTLGHTLIATGSTPRIPTNPVPPTPPKRETIMIERKTVTLEAAAIFFMERYKLDPVYKMGLIKQIVYGIARGEVEAPTTNNGYKSDPKRLVYADSVVKFLDVHPVHNGSVL